jgi:hypothetical protein
VGPILGLNGRMPGCPKRPMMAPKPSHSHVTFSLPIMHGTTGGNEPHATTKIFTGKLLDPYSLELLDKRVITISEYSGLIIDVRAFSDEDYRLDSWTE